MALTRIENGPVVKYVHDDGSETIIKRGSSCKNIVDKKTGEVKTSTVDRNKYSVFVSSSVGCPVGCKFCQLTVNKVPYVKLTGKQIVSNVYQAVANELDHDRSLCKRYMKLSFMGMGDVFLMNPYEFRSTVKSIIGRVIGDHGLAKGLDGVDISTVLPKSLKAWPMQLGLLNDELHWRYKANPTCGHRSMVRVFFSLHIPDFTVRGEYIPMPGNTLKLFRGVEEFNTSLSLFGVDTLVHHMFLDGVNDSDHDLQMLYLAMHNYFPESELRLIRYNQFEGSPYKESERFDELVRKCARNLPKVKYQVSEGTEIRAACGMFG